MLCAFCTRLQLAKGTEAGQQRRWTKLAGSLVASVSALIVSWTFFYLAGRLLSQLSKVGGQ